VYCLEPLSSYLLCVNSSNRDKDYAWMTQQNAGHATVRDMSEDFSMLALQGPAAASILKACLGFDDADLRPFSFAVTDTPAYGELVVSKTGYTGAGGVEIFLDAKAAPALWQAFIRGGATPCGLGARDTLRLEMGYPLHGNDIDETTTPLEAGLDFAVDLLKEDFIGARALREQKGRGLTRRLAGLAVQDRGIPREHCRCLKDGHVVGAVTSGSISPVSGRGIALAYVDALLTDGEELFIEVRDRTLRSVITKPPFVAGTLQE
jgi:aminomethyltransferase